MKRIFTFLFVAAATACFNFLNAATFSSLASGTWSVPATWSITSGTDANGIPDSDDDVTINAGHNISMTSRSAAQSLTVAASSTLTVSSQIFDCYGNFIINGRIFGTIAPFFYGTNSLFSSSATITNNGDWHVRAGTLTIASGTILSKQSYIIVYSGAKVINQGNINLFGGSLNLSGTAIFENRSNSVLSVARNIVGIGTLNASFIPNTVNYTSNQINSIKGATYYNLTINGASTKSLTTHVTILNNLALGTSTLNILNLNNFNVTIGGNWANNANTTLTNQGTITFNGSGTQTISRASNEVLNNMVLSGSGTVQLNRSINVSALTVNSGSLDVSTSNFTVNIARDLINNGTINPRQGLFNFNGTNAQTINGSSNTQFYNLTLNNLAGLTVNSPQSLTNILTNSNGNFNANGNFTLISDASNTARIAPVTGSFSGNMTIQKFISSRAGKYHDLSSPVSNSTIMDWDNELYMSGIGSNDGIAGPAGVDGSAGGGSSVWHYNEPTAAWMGVTGTGYALTPGKGYEIYIADLFIGGLAANGGTWAGRAIDSRGVPNYGSLTVNLSYTGAQGSYAGYNLIGNPYASAVDYSACTKTNIIGNPYYMQDGNWTDAGANPTIPAHQGIWVFASGPGASITFLENAKSTSTSTSFYRTQPDYGIKLLFSSPILPYYQENTIHFNETSTLGYDKELDALYMKSPFKTAPAIYMLTNTDTKLITNTINTDEENVTIPLALYTPQEGVYYIEPNVLSTNNYNYVWIENTKTGKKYELNSSITIVGKENDTNTDYVLRLSKKSSESDVNQAIFDNDMLVFGSENTINLKAINSTHYLSKVAIYDITGKLMLEETNLIVETGNTTKIDISNLSSGVYIVNVTDLLGHIKTQKIIR